MRALLLRFWHWLGRVLGVDRDIKVEARNTSSNAEQPSTPGATVAPLAPTVTLPPPPAPQFDLHTGEPPRYARKASVLTKPEQKLYGALLLAVDDRYRVLPKVRLWDFLWLENDPPDRKQHLSRLSCRHVDFLLCTPGTLAPLMVIELDDSSHQRPEAQEADRYKDELFAHVNLPLLRLDKPDYSSRILREQIEARLTGNK